MKLYPHQIESLKRLKDKNRVALYWEMGLGKTYGGSEKLKSLGAKINLVVCQKSKINDWIDHFQNNYPESIILDLTEKQNLTQFLSFSDEARQTIGVINYDLIWRRKELLKLSKFTLLLDESSLIQNEQSKRSKFILKLQPANVILLSGTPVGGKYENLWSQMHLLGWPIKKKMFYNHYVDYHWDDSNGFPLMIIDGYKNEERLKRKMRQYGCDFIKTDEVFDLPEQIDQIINIPITKEYKKFGKDSIVTVDDIELVGDTILTEMLYARQLCGQYNQYKLDAFQDLLESTNDRLIVFYNFNAEYELLKKIAVYNNRLISVVNGQEKNLEAYEHCRSSITFIQYQAGAKGLNLQKANKIIFFTLTLSTEDYMQAKKRIHRIGQSKPCFYYHLICKNSIEEKIYHNILKGIDYTERLFLEDVHSI